MGTFGEGMTALSLPALEPWAATVEAAFVMVVGVVLVEAVATAAPDIALRAVLPAGGP
jgi:hypothetical protein